MLYRSMLSRLTALLLLPFLVLVLLACQKEEPDTPPPPQTPTPQSPNPSTTPRQTDLACRMVKVTNVKRAASGASDTLVLHLEYDSQGRLVKRTHSDGEVLTYEYNELDQLVKTFRDYPPTSSAKDETRLEQYDAQGRWVKSTINVVDNSQAYVIHYDQDGNRSRVDLLNQAGTVIANHSYTYRDGNMIRYVFKGALSKDSSVINYEHYPDQKNQYRAIAGSMGHYYGLPTASQNLVKKTTTSYNGLPFPVETTYVFNSQGFITQATSVEVNTGNTTTITYQYECQ